MTDTERLDALSVLVQIGSNFDDICVSIHGVWQWYDWRGHPNHKGWTDAKGFRQAIDKFLATRKYKPGFLDSISTP